MSGRGGRREAARFWRFFCGKRAAFSYVFLFCVLFMGGGTVSLASQAGLKPGTEGGEAAGPDGLDSGGFDEMDAGDEDGEDFDLSAYEGDVTEEELDQALEEYIRQMDLDALIQSGEAAGKVEDPPLTMEWEDGAFKYTLPNGNFFLSSVPNGMITAERVELKLPEGAIGLARFNDESEKFVNSRYFAEKGSYSMRLLMFQQPGDMATDYNLYEVHFCFTIIGKQEKALGAFPAPQGFDIKEVRRNGTPVKPDSERCFFLGEDGYYEIRCESEAGEGLFVETGFFKDTTAPFLSFSEEREPGGITGPVEFYPSEEGCRIYMDYNGNRGYAVGNVLTAAGNYELSVEDAAGNRRAYRLRIRQTYDLMDGRLLLLILIMLAIIGIRLAAARRDMRVL